MNTVTPYNRVRRSTAGISKRYDEQDYLLVSFPQLNKHSIVPAASVNVDPLDKQNGSIKTFGSKKSLRIIGTGPKEVMKERASRYAASAGSEEVELVPDEPENFEDQDIDDDDYSPAILRRTNKENKKPVLTGGQTMSEIEVHLSEFNNQTTLGSSYECSPTTSSLKKGPLTNRQLNFDRVYSSKTGTKRSFEENLDESSLSGSDVVDSDDGDNNSHVIKKSNELKSLLKKSRRRSKKRTVESTKAGPCTSCLKYEERLVLLDKRISRLEKVIPVIKKFRSKEPAASTHQTNSILDNNQVYSDVEKITGVNPNQLRSTTSRPTMVMRELIKKSERINDRAFVQENEVLLKQFIQMKCIIHDDLIDDAWKEIKDSLNRQHIDEENNKKKRIRYESSSTTTNTTPQQHSQAAPTPSEQQAASTPSEQQAASTPGEQQAVSTSSEQGAAPSITKTSESTQ